MAEFSAAIIITLAFEGGFSNHPLDYGGPTKYGITEETARLHGYTGDIRDLTIEEAKEIYKKGYWDYLRLSEINNQDIANKVFDIGVNQGPVTAIKFLQRALNYLNRNERDWKDVTVDGCMGPETINAVNNLDNKDIKLLYKGLAGFQFKRYVEIVQKNPLQRVFFKGWVKRI